MSDNADTIRTRLEDLKAKGQVAAISLLKADDLEQATRTKAARGNITAKAVLKGLPEESD